MSPFPPKSHLPEFEDEFFPPVLASNSNNSFRIMVFSSPFTLSAFQGRSSFYWLIAAIFKQLLQLINVVGFSVYALCVHYMNRKTFMSTWKKLTWQYKHLSNMWQSSFRGKEWSFETDPGFKIRHRDLSVFYQFRARDFTSKKFRALKL